MSKKEHNNDTLYRLIANTSFLMITTALIIFGGWYGTYLIEQETAEYNHFCKEQGSDSFAARKGNLLSCLNEKTHLMETYHYETLDIINMKYAVGHALVILPVLLPFAFLALGLLLFYSIKQMRKKK